MNNRLPNKHVQCNIS